MQLVSAAFVAFIIATSAAKELKNGRRIIGGAPISIKNVPWLVALFSRVHYDPHKPVYIRFRCSGSILSEYYVLTAAHCTKGDGRAITHIRYGTDNSDYGFTDLVHAIHIHPEFLGKENSNKHDIAILELKAPLVFSDYVSKITLSLDEPQAEEIAMSIGWGREAANGTNSKRLKGLFTKILDKETCAENAVGIRVTPDYICADNPMGGICRGDSGGPLVVGKPPFTPNNKHYNYLQAGLASFHLGRCADPDLNDMYMSLSYNKGFIDKITLNTTQWDSQYN